MSGDPVEMVLEFFQAFSRAPLAPRQYLELLLVRSGTEELLVYNYRKTVPIFALNRFFFCDFCLSSSHLNRLLKRGPESAKTDYLL